MKQIVPGWTRKRNLFYQTTCTLLLSHSLQHRCIKTNHFNLLLSNLKSQDQIFKIKCDESSMQDAYYDTEEAILEDFGLEPALFDEVDVEDTFAIYQDVFDQYMKEQLKAEKNLFPTDQVQDFVQEQDRPYLVLLNYLYENVSRKADDPWKYIEDLPPSDHIAVWENMDSGTIFVGCRGTSPFNPSGWQDLADDIQIVFGVQKLVQTLARAGNTKVLDPLIEKAASKLDVCQTMFITNQGRTILKAIMNRGIPSSQIVIGGHSLGGRASACLGVEFDLARVVLFNAAAPATNPLQVGLGPNRQIHYHIAGDLISTHSDPSKMQVIVVDNSSYAIPNTSTMPPMLMLPGEMRRTYPYVDISKAIDFDLVGHHLLSNFLKTKPYKGVLTLDVYDTMWVYWSNHFSQETGKSLLVGVMTLGLLNLLLYFVAWNYPIPGSRRDAWLKKLSTFCGNTAIAHIGDRLNCIGRVSWTKTVALALGPIVVPFFTAFYGLAFSAVALVASVNGLQKIDQLTKTTPKRLKWS